MNFLQATAPAGVAVTVSARLHLGFLDLNGESGSSAAWVFRSASRVEASHCVAPARLGSAGRTGGSRLEVQREAAPLYALSQNADDPAELWERALLFDASLKQRRLNPGATADLTVATLFVRQLRDLGLPNFSPDVLQSRRNND
jgi:ATP:dephospho-CoA triphosphoribosyl transferase